MKDYYELLGVPQNASQEEIKRSYFKRVRQFSPEKDPEHFLEIREAYEYLKEHDGQTFIQIPTPKQEKAKNRHETAMRFLESNQFNKAVLFCEESIRVFPMEPIFYYLLSKAQQSLGKTGKAIRNLELLAEQFPDILIFKTDLALAYRTRGHSKKALTMFKRVFELGERSEPFLMEFCEHCLEGKQIQEALKLLDQLVGLSVEKSKERSTRLLELFFSFLLQEWEMSEQDLNKFLHLFATYLEEFFIFLLTEKDLVANIFYLLSKLCGTRELDMQLFRKLGEVVKRFFSETSEKARVLQIGGVLESILIQKDERFREELKAVAEIYEEMLTADLPFETKKEFLDMERKLCLLEEYPGIEPELLLFEQEFPSFFESIKDFVTVLRSTADLQYQKGKLLKEYNRKYRHMGGYYAERYLGDNLADYKPAKEDLEEWVDREQPLIRIERKIGRNDPCPCGSGKKYKQCCGKF